MILLCLLEGWNILPRQGQCWSQNLPLRREGFPPWPQLSWFSWSSSEQCWSTCLSSGCTPHTHCGWRTVILPPLQTNMVWLRQVFSDRFSETRAKICCQVEGGSAWPRSTALYNQCFLLSEAPCQHNSSENPWKQLNNVKIWWEFWQPGHERQSDMLQQFECKLLSLVIMVQPRNSCLRQRWDITDQSLMKWLLSPWKQFPRFQCLVDRLILKLPLLEKVEEGTPLCSSLLESFPEQIYEIFYAVLCRNVCQQSFVFPGSLLGEVVASETCSKLLSLSSSGVWKMLAAEPEHCLHKYKSLQRRQNQQATSRQEHPHHTRLSLFEPSLLNHLKEAI